MTNYGTGIQKRIIDDSNVRIDGRYASISAEILEKNSSPTAEAIYTNPAQMLKQNKNVLPSFSLIRYAKIKNFIDGVYAIAELEVAKTGHDFSRPDFLDRLEAALSEPNPKAYVTLARALESNNLDSSEGLIMGLEKALANPSVNIVQGFYDWSSNLHSVWRQIRATGTEPAEFFGGEESFSKEVMQKIMQVINSDNELRKRCASINALYARLTDKQKEKACLFPPALMPDQEFFIEYSGRTQSDLTEGLGNVLVEAIKRGEVSFKPKRGSGLYTRQMFEVEPLVLKDTEEFEKFIPGEKYSKAMEQEFISQWAGTRHTHVAHSDFPRAMTCAIPVSRLIYISPELQVEPFSTCYERMRKSLEFFKTTLTDAFGSGFLKNRRLLNNGERSEKEIGQEFDEMDLLLQGLSSISKDSIHQQYNPERGTDRAVAAASDWILNLSKDPDLNRNTAIFVPIIRTADGSRQVGYINVGFMLKKLRVKYKDYPDVKTRRLVEFCSEVYSLPVLVHREVRIHYNMKNMINDKMLRERAQGVLDETQLEGIVKFLEK